MSDNDQTERTAELPPLPDDDGGSGWDWMKQLVGGWHPVEVWGPQGRNLGSWPFVIYVHVDLDGRLFGLGEYVEGDLFVEAYSTREERDRATDKAAFWHWSREDGNELEERPAEEQIPQYGPYKGSF